MKSHVSFAVDNIVHSATKKWLAQIDAVSRLLIVSAAAVFVVVAVLAAAAVAAAVVALYVGITITMKQTP